MFTVLIVFLVAIAIQIIYLLAFIIAFSRKQKEEQPQSLPVSVIVCAHDEEQNLRELIPQLLAQDYPEFEIIIVDDRSNDSTFDLLLDETKKDHRLRMVHVNRTPPHVNSKKYSLTLGIKAARFEWLLLTDADCRPESKSWISLMSKHFTESKQFVLGYSPYYKKPGFLNMFIRFESIWTAIQYLSFALLGNPYMGVGRNLAYRRSLFLNKKGFNDFLNVTGGDDDLFVNQHARGSNTGVSLDKDSVVHSIPEGTWGAFFRQKTRHLSVGKFYRFQHRFLLGVFALTWLLTWFMGIPLAALFSEFLYIILGALAVRIILLTITTQVAVKRLGQRFETWIVPLLDFLYSFYYLTTGLITLVSKKVRWKN